MSTIAHRSIRLVGRCKPQFTPPCATTKRLRRYHDDAGRFGSCSRQHECIITPQAQRRNFGSSPRWHAAAVMKAVKPSVKKQPQASLAVQQKQGIEMARQQGLMQDDLGLLPDTFVMPRGPNRPSWLTNFQGRRRMEWARLKIRFFEYLSAVVYRFSYIRPTPRLRIFRIPDVARSMHKEMYTHFAEGNLAPIEGRICTGLLGSLRARLAQRTPNTQLKWTLHRYLSTPWLMSYKAAILPGPKGETARERNGIVQAVVRIHSLQSLRHVKRVTQRNAYGQLVSNEVVVDAQGRELPGSEVESGEPKDAKESLEYFVIQKSLRKSEEGPWMIWGTAEEMTLTRLKKYQNQSSKDLLQQG